VTEEKGFEENVTSQAPDLGSHDFRLQLIPSSRTDKTALDYHKIHIDLAGAAASEPLVNLKDYGLACRSAYARAKAPYYKSFDRALPDVFLRKTVAEKLTRVNEVLIIYDAQVVALDGFRPIPLQEELWHHFIEQGRQTLAHPTAEDLVKFAGTFCSDPRGFDKNDYRTWPVHNTGGSIDLTLQSLTDQQELFMGSIFDDADQISSTRYFEDANLNSSSADEARRNRRLLYHAMLSQGFANYHHEWWHFDYGTQMWIMNSGHADIALYGRAEL
jgi:D-alanyl-D-alanine dipeptidase